MLNLAIGKDPETGDQYLMFTDMDTDEKYLLARFDSQEASQAFQLYWVGMGGGYVPVPTTDELNRLLDGDTP